MDITLCYNLEKRDRMTFDQMVYFQIIAQTKSLNKASELLHISQPALTKQIKALESELGVNILNRSKQGVSLTKEGRFFLEQIQEILYRIQSLKQKMTDIKKGNPSIRIGALPSISSYLLPSLIKYIETRGYQLDIKVLDTSSEIGDLLAQGKIDIGFTQDLSQDTNYSYTVLVEPYFLVTPKTHFLAKLSSVSLSKLQKVRMVLPKHPCDIRISLDKYLACNGLELDNIIEVNQNESILSLVKNGLGLALIPKMATASVDENLEYIPLKEVQFNRKISFITHTDHIKNLVLEFM